MKRILSFKIKKLKKRFFHKISNKFVFFSLRSIRICVFILLKKYSKQAFWVFGQNSYKVSKLKNSKKRVLHIFWQINAYTDRLQRDKHEFVIGLAKKNFV
jgi:hypothetical protein